uniref:Phosphatidylglycerol lysyltransferase C-terminal domain-containing protein n=1 Tax=Schizophyllum commune (strain H4-8 / FGSC 9210) TaxID=578458 RepID=D8QCZ8_SCHCM
MTSSAPNTPQIQSLRLKAFAADETTEELSLDALEDDDTSEETATPDTFDRNSISELVASHGSSSSTAWLEFSRYKIWQASKSIAPSTFVPVQGYMRKGNWVFAWGNPIVSTPDALEAAARAFVQYISSLDSKLKVVWVCVDQAMERALGEMLGWSTVHCIYEDVIDPRRVIEVVDAPEKKNKRGEETKKLSKEEKEHQEIIKDLKKNLRRAEKAGVTTGEVVGELSEEDRVTIEKGIDDWKKHRHGIQIASTTMVPWLDKEHRRYWLARDANSKVNTSLSYMHGHPEHPHHISYQIKNAVSFPDAPKGTSEKLIYSALRDLDREQTRKFPSLNIASDRILTSSPELGRYTVTFGISAANSMVPTHNLSGWKVHTLSNTYNKVAKSTGLLNRLEFRKKFESIHEPMFVCYPEDGFGLDGVMALLKALRK